MTRLIKKLQDLAADERGGEAIEYAIVAGLVVVVAVVLIAAVGEKVLARWTSVNSSM